MEIELFKHNEKAYQKLKYDLLSKQYTTINHATGTGKSFIALKYLYENRDKRILYLTPTKPIYRQLIRDHMKTLGINIKDFKKFDSIIYPNLGKYNMEELAKDYDIIVFDEYHRLGAKKWGKFALKLKNIIKEKYPEKKIIGLTATNIRYLDNERNMTEELFDNNCSSTLSLAEAIISGILPAPTYVNTAISYRETIENLRKRIDKNLYYEKDKRKYLDILDKASELIEATITGEDNFKPYLNSGNGKYIAFNPTIESIKENKEKIKQWFGTDNINFFVVHSRQKDEVNDRVLEDFKKANNGINVICVVDILNEGVHVSGIDGILMLRKTTSPIIYFQQLGRLLSFSTRQKDLVVWDLVDNLTHHKAINDLYVEVKEVAKRKMKEDPEHEEFYKNILNKFKIVDNTTEIYSRIETIKEVLSNEKLIRCRLNTAIDILIGKFKVPAGEILQAHLDLFKYKNFVDIEMFDKLEFYKIVKPQELECTREQFLAKLQGYTCINDLMKINNSNIISDFYKFIKINKRVPSVFTDNLEEKYLAIRTADIKTKLKSTEYNKLKKVLENNKVSAFDKVFYGFRIEDKYFEEISIILRDNMYNMDIINNNVIQFLKRNISYEEYGFKYYLSLLEEKGVVKNKEHLGKRLIKFAEENKRFPKYNIDNKEELALYLELMERPKDYVERYRFIIENQKYLLYSCDDEEEIKEELELIANELLIYIDKNECLPIKDLTDEGKRLYGDFLAYKKLLKKYGYLDKINSLLSQKKLDRYNLEINKLIPELLIFIRENYGDLPSRNSEDINEVLLAKKYFKYKKHFSDEQRIIIDNEIRLIKEKEGNDNWLNMYIEFIYKHKRKPINNSDDPEEQRLYEAFQRNFVKLKSSEKEKITKAENSVGGSKSVLKNSLLEIYNKVF